MFIDQTEISIRERGKRELFDLALHVARRHFAPLCTAMLLGAAPFAAFNAWVLWDIPWDRYDGESRLAYVTQLTLLVIIAAPLATSLMTIYLGQVLFRTRATTRQLFRELARSAGQLLWYQGIVRGSLFALLAAAFQRFGDRSGFANFVIWAVALWAIAARGLRPYLNEVILLERNPRRATGSTTMTTARRNAALHAGFGGDSIVQLIGAGILGSMAAASIWLTLCYLRAEFFNAIETDRATMTVLLPIALWLTVWFLAIVRFLGYLDLRIRREGWEVELAIRAEAASLARTTTY
ncbi:MAG: hypothetical protein WD875_06915 [Pirellulales bacterium]